MNQASSLSSIKTWIKPQHFALIVIVCLSTADFFSPLQSSNVDEKQRQHHHQEQQLVAITQAPTTATSPVLSSSKNATPTTIEQEEQQQQQQEQQLVAITQAPTTATSPVSASDKNASTTTIVVQLSGELGNQISKITYGLCLQLFAKEKFGIHPTEIKLRAQEIPKWRHAMKDTKACFPNTRPFDFREMNTPEFDAAKRLQNEWLGKDRKNDAELLETQRCISQKCVNDTLSVLKKTLMRTDLPGMASNKNISVPFIYADSFTDIGFWNRYYKEIREFFIFDDSVCKKLPEPDETVLHVRNFLTEMPKRGKRMGFEELSANKTASELFANASPGEKVAIISRFPNNVKEHKEALEAKGLVVRVITGQSGVEDFCFLLRAQKEIVGVFTSTFAKYAGLLGDAKRVRLYSVDSRSTRIAGKKSVPSMNFTNDELRSRIYFENYKAEDVE